MSLNQLTANYTDSEGEDNSKSPNDALGSSADEDRVFDREHFKENTPSLDSKGSAANTPKKRIGKLVSYANEDDDDDPIMDEDDTNTEPDEILNSEPMDTGTEDGEDEKSSDDRDHGIKLPPPPTAKCSTQLQEKIASYLSKMKHGNMDYNARIQNKKEFRNPSIYEKLIDHLGLDEIGSNYPLEMFDPHCWGKESFYDELARLQKEEMEKREKERKEKTKVDIISGTKKPAEEELKKQRKSRFDQTIPGATLPLKVTAPPTLASSLSTSSKTTISAFGALKKSR